MRTSFNRHPAKRPNSHTQAARFIGLVWLLALSLFSSPLQAQHGFQFGAVYAKSLILSEQGNPIYVEYGLDGEIAGEIGEATGQYAEARVMAGQIYRAYQIQLEAVREQFPDLELVSKDTYESATYTTVGGVAIPKPPLGGNTVMVAIRPLAQRLIADSSQLVLQELPINPQLQIGNDTQSVLLDPDGAILAQSTLNIGFKTGFVSDDAGNERITPDRTLIYREHDDTIHGPLGYVVLENGLFNRDATGEDGKFAFRYPLPPCPGFYYDLQMPIYVELYYKRFNPRRSPRYPYFMRRLGFDYCVGYGQWPLGASLTATMTQVSALGIVAAMATPLKRPLDFVVDMTVLAGQARMYEVSFGSETRYDGESAALQRVSQLQNDFDGDGHLDRALLGQIVTEVDPDTGEESQHFQTLDATQSPQIQGIWLSSYHDLATLDPAATLPDLTRLTDWSADFQNRGLLSQINEDDLINTDLYVFRVSDGTLVTERHGLRDSEVSENFIGVDSDNGTFYYTIQVVGAQEGRLNIHGYTSYQRGGSDAFQQWQATGQMNPDFYERKADHLRPGEAVQLIAINRATGYIGSLITEVKQAGSGANPHEISFPIQDLMMGPPNLKIWAERTSRIEHGLTRGQTLEQAIGHEGAGLTDDTEITIFTEWFNHDGTALPEGLDEHGYTGRLAKVVSPNQLASVGGSSGSGSSLSQFEIKTGRQTQVIRLPERILGRQHLYVQVSGEPMSGNPDFGSSGQHEGKLEYRPDRYVPVRVPVYDESSSRLQTRAYNLTKRAYDQGRLAVEPEKPDPIYHYIYRPEFQFSIYDLVMDEIRRTNLAGETTDILALDQPLIDSTDQLIELFYDLTVPNHDPLAPYGYEGERELVLTLGAEEVRVTVGANQQLSFNNLDHLDALTAEDLLTIRLASNNDMGNTLWEYAFDNRIVKVLNPNIEKRMRIDLPNDWVCPDSAYMALRVNEDAYLTLELNGELILNNEFRARGNHYIEMPEMNPGTYICTLDSVSARDGTSETDQASYQVKYDIVKSVAIGHAIEENVDLFDGHLGFSVDEFNINDRGPALNFRRTFNSNTSELGVLGIGWSHNYDAKVTNLGCGAYAVRSGNSGGKFFQQGGGFTPEAGVHSRLEKNGDSFDFYAKDGTHYHFKAYLFSKPRINTPVGGTGYEWYLEYIEDPDGNRTSIAYDEDQVFNAYVTSVTDNSGRQITFDYLEIDSALVDQYFKNDKVISSITAPDTQIDFSYDSSGRLTSVDNNGYQESYTYESVTQTPGELVWNEEEKIKLAAMLSRTDRNGNRTTYNYTIEDIAYTQSLAGGDQHQTKGVLYSRINHPASDSTVITYGTRADRSLTELTANVTNPRGLSGNYTLNGYGAPLTIIRDNGTVRMTWDMQEIVMSSRTDERGVTTAYQYDSYGNITSEETGSLPAITRSWTQQGPIVNLLASETDRNGETTDYSYNAAGHVTRIDHPDATSESFTYASNGDRQSSANRRGITTTYSYDGYGNLASVTAPDQGTTSYQWDVRSLTTRMSDGEGRVTGYSYDALGRLTREDLPIGNRRYSYDGNGNKLTETDTLGRVTSWSYDGDNRITGITRPIGSKSLSYDGAGDLVSETDWNGNTTTYGYNSVHHRTRETRPLGLIASISNDALGNVTRIDWPDLHFVAYTYDDLSRRTSTTDPSGTVTLVLDGNGNKTRKTDQLTRITNYVYDSMNRLTEINEPLSRSTTQTYDGNGNLATLTDPNGNVTTNTYDDADRLLTSEKGGDTTSHSYDRVGNLLSRTDAENRITRYTYDAMNRRLSLALDNYSESYSYDLAGNLTGKTTPVNRFSYTYDDLNRQLSETDNLGSVSGTSYDANGNVLSQIDANGNTTSYVYNALNFLTREEQPEGRNIVYTPDLFGNVLTKTDANGVAYSYVYDELNRLTSETHPNGSLSYTYDAVGNRRTLTDKRNNQTRYDYNDLNRLTLTTDPIGTFRNSYDDNGNVLTETDRRGLVNAYSYDAWDRVLTTTRAGLLIETNVYDGVGNRSRVTDANGNAIDYDYNHLDLVTEERAPLSATTRYSYNTGGQRISMTDPENRQTSYVPDARGRNLTETFQSLTTSYSYDGNGNLTGKTRPGGNSWSFVYDGANRLTSVTGPAGTTSYTYDHNDNRLSQTDAGTNTTGYAYDSNNLLRTLTYPDLTTETYAYDANGNRTSANLPNGNSWSATYDEDNRLITRSHNDGQSQTNSYDGNNNLTGVTFNNGGSSASASYVYDNFDRQTRATDRNSHVVNYQYDDNGNRTQVSSTGGVTNYVYDALNRVTQVTGSDGVTGYSYDNSGLPTRVDYPSGISAITAYDAQGRIDTLTNQQGSTLLSSYDYAYDSNSNRTEQIEINGGAAETTGYSYDSADRLTQVDYPETSVVYTYDANFNRLSEVETRLSDSAVIKDQSYAYNNRNQLTGITDNLDAANNVTYSYDDNGNQTRKVKGTETTDFIYNARDELRQVQVGGSTVGQFLYDYQGMRVQKTGDRGVEQYHYDGKSVLAQYDETDQLIAHFQYGPNRLLSLQEPGGDAEYYLFDSLGSPVNLTTGAGAVTARYQYDAWGNKRSETGTSFNRFGFTGHEEDTETGLIYAKARYYDPDTGRFLNQDLFEGMIDTPPSLHRYLYAYANPTTYVDLNGYEAITIRPGMGPAGAIPGMMQQHWQADYDGNGRTVGEEALTPVINLVNKRVNQIKIGIELYGAAQRHLLGLDVTNNDAITSESIESRVITEDPGSMGTEGRPIEDPIPHPGGFEGEERGAWGTDGDQIPEELPRSYETPIQENGTTIYGNPDQSEQIDSGPYLRERERDEFGRYKASTDIPEGRLNRAYPWAETKRKIQQQAIEQGYYNPETGNFIDPNTGLEIEGDYHYGHTYGNESWHTRDEATKAGMSQEEYNKAQQAVENWQIEDPKSNMSHEYEMKY
ncbi:MAG: GH-E family nuclease [Candidatus Thiodiazotropha lotti]|nr:GH-E family nuclease [Candidatus Thiodiazotropha lotti]